MKAIINFMISFNCVMPTNDRYSPNYSTHCGHYVR